MTLKGCWFTFAFVNAVSSGAGSAAMKVTGNANFSRAVSLASGVAGGSKSGKVLNSLDDIGTSTVKSLNHLDDVADGVKEVKKPINNSVDKNPSDIAKSWQGSGKYPGIDKYKDITIKEGKIIYRGEPNGTEYFTTKSAIERSGRDATKIFEGLQVEKNPIHGYRGTMQGYKATRDVDAAFGITKANPQFGKGGLPQVFVPDAENLVKQGVLVPVDNIQLKK